MAGEERTRGARSGLPAGRVGRAHGLDGSFYVADARPRLLQPGMVVKVGQTARAVVRLAGAPQRPIVRVEGIEDRDAARALHGVELTVEQALAPELGEDEWWAEELEGCTVAAGERVLGIVTRLIRLPSCEALEVRGPDGGESLLVPMVKDAVRSVAVADRRIEVSLEFLGLEDAAPQGLGPASVRPGGEGRA